MSLSIPLTTVSSTGCTLHDWSVHTVVLPGIGTPTVHIAGFSRREGFGRASSPVVGLDPKARCVVTRSGNVYRLAGKPGLHGDGEFVWNNWKRNWAAVVVADESLEMQLQLAAGPLNG